jgi:hypothetical protein
MSTDRLTEARQAYTAARSAAEKADDGAKRR